MAFQMNRFFYLTSLAFLFCLVVSCSRGGGGGGANSIEVGFSNAALQNQYVLTEVGHESLSTPSESWSAFGSFNFDSIDNFNADLIANVNGSVYEGSTFGIYSVSEENGYLSCIMNDGTSINGGIQKGGNLFYTDCIVDEEVGFSIGVKSQGNGIGIDGEYFFVSFGFYFSETQVSSYSATGGLIFKQDSPNDGHYYGLNTELYGGILYENSILGLKQAKVEGKKSQFCRQKYVQKISA